MKTIYKIMDNPGPDDPTYKAYQVPEDFPIEFGYTALDPTEFSYPIWDGSKWVENTAKLISYLQYQVKQLTIRVDALEGKSPKE